MAIRKLKMQYKHMIKCWVLAEDEIKKVNNRFEYLKNKFQNYQTKRNFN